MCYNISVWGGLIMKKKDLDKLLRNVYRFKTLNDHKRNTVMMALEEFRESDPLYYNKNVGKLCTLFGPVDMAIKHLNVAKELDEKSPSIYYNLYKCHVKKKDFNTAFMNLYNCVQVDEGIHNFNLPMMMLSSLVDMDLDFDEYLNGDYSVDKSSGLCFNEINDPKLLSMYNDVVDAFNKRDYNTVLRKLGTMKGHIENIKYPMEVDTLMGITRGLILKEKQKYNDIFNSDCLDCLDIDEYTSFIQGLFKNGNISLSKIFVHLEKIAMTDPDKCEEFINVISTLDEFKDKEFEFNYLRGLISEKRSINELEPEVMSDYLQLMSDGKELLKKRRFGDALRTFEEALSISGLNICNYYIGKTLFLMSKIGPAKGYFEKYLEVGGEKSDKAYLYIIGICDMRKWNNKEYVRDMLRIHSLFERTYKYVPRSVHDPEDDFDKKKFKESKRLEFSEEEFMSSNLSVEDYYEVDTDGKLKIIRDLFRSGKSEVANKLLEELNKTCDKKDKNKVLQMIRNKKIFSNQNRG